MKKKLIQQIWFALGLLAFASTTVFAATDKIDQSVFRIGYQKYGTLIILKARGALEKRLEPLGIQVKWTEFPAGPQLLEGLNVGSIDFGTVGEAPPVFAQAAGAQLVYVGNEPPSPRSEAIVVPKNSPIKNVAELKGKKIALNKGSNVHYLLVQALERAGVAWKDIEPIYLPPSDARAAFERGSVDAWVIWDPFFAAAEKSIEARVLTDGRGLVSNHQFYLASQAYAAKRSDVIKLVFDELKKIDDWGRQNPQAVAEFLAPQIGLDVATVTLAAARYSYGIQYITPDVVVEQQKIADSFHKLGLIPKAISIKEVVWSPKNSPAKIAEK